MWTFLKINNLERDTYTIFIRKMKKTLHLLLVLFFFIACKSENERRIVGKWQALQLLECDNVVPIQIELVDIEFMSNGKYIFHSTLNTKEEGSYRIRKNFLFTQDKMREKAPEKAVLIKSIEDDTLVLQMSFKGKDQWLTLVREGIQDKPRDKKEAQIPTDASGVPTAVAASTNLTINPSDSIQKAEEQRKQDEADKETQRKKDEVAADKKREDEADRKREAARKDSKKAESSFSASEAYKKREAKRIADERKAKEEADKKAAKFRKEYAIREADRKKREAQKN